MSYARTVPYRGRQSRRHPRSRFQRATIAMLKLAVSALLGLGGYLFIMEVAAPAVVDGIVGQSQSDD